MNVNRWPLFWGVLLIGGGVLALLSQLGYLEDLSPTLWIFIFAAISLFGLVSYAMSGWKQWGWLFPAGIFGGLSVIVALLEAGVDDAALGSALFFGLLIPFAAAYLTDRTRKWWALSPGGVMLFLALGAQGRGRCEQKQRAEPVRGLCKERGACGGQSGRPPDSARGARLDPREEAMSGAASARARRG